jgi:excisionase family DNA binding protein
VNASFLENLPPLLPIGPLTNKSFGPGNTSACDLCQCGRTTMYGWINSGKVRAVKMGRYTRIDTASLLDHLSNLPEVQTAS